MIFVCIFVYSIGGLYIVGEYCDGGVFIFKVVVIGLFVLVFVSIVVLIYFLYYLMYLI